MIRCDWTYGDYRCGLPSDHEGWHRLRSGNNFYFLNDDNIYLQGEDYTLEEVQNLPPTSNEAVIKWYREIV